MGLSMSEFMASIIDWAIPLLVGVVATLWGFGVIDPGAKKRQKEMRLATQQERAPAFLRVLGPVMIVVSILGIIGSVVRWQR